MNVLGYRLSPAMARSLLMYHRTCLPGHYENNCGFLIGHSNTDGALFRQKLLLRRPGSIGYLISKKGRDVAEALLSD